MKKYILAIFVALLPVSADALSCVGYVNSVYPSAPLVDAEWYQMFPKTMMSVGSVAMFTYRNGVSHVGIVEGFEKDCFWMSDYNRVADGKYGYECIPYDHYALRGFWKPAEYTPTYSLARI